MIRRVRRDFQTDTGKTKGEPWDIRDDISTSLLESFRGAAIALLYLAATCGMAMFVASVISLALFLMGDQLSVGLTGGTVSALGFAMCLLLLIWMSRTIDALKSGRPKHIVSNPPTWGPDAPLWDREVDIFRN